MNLVLVDTDVLIDFTKGHDRLLAKLLKEQLQGKIELYVTPVNIVEFLDDQHLKEPEKRQEAQKFLHLFSVCECTRSIGVLAGTYMREKKTLFLGDAMIAATCVEVNMPLVTRNRRHFSKIPDLIFYTK